ncbi:MAG TPA: hypothetical protein DEF47_09340 [Herpetosiphon sp.]|uniref:hypothetical protein n=1 Tax=Herpetosiphon sp. TaxID=71864 RepID=UPI0002FF3B27|nr:hypothetical protein [Herpetosiphon sp.]HBW50097.1 hypothetical protein [Herpetosiphon sp.]
MDNNELKIYIFTNEDINSQKAANPHISDTLNLLSTIDLEHAAYIIHESDIIAYDWREQTIKIINSWHNRPQETPFFMHEGSKVIVVFQQQRIILTSLLSEDTARFIPSDETAMYSSFRQNHIFYSFRYGSLLQTAQSYPFLNPDPAIAEAVKQHLRQLGKLVE